MRLSEVRKGGPWLVSLSLSDEIESLLTAVWNYREMTEPIKLTLGDDSIIIGETLEDADENLSTGRTKFSAIQPAVATTRPEGAPRSNQRTWKGTAVAGD